MEATAGVSQGVMEIKYPKWVNIWASPADQSQASVKKAFSAAVILFMQNISIFQNKLLLQKKEKKKKKVWLPLIILAIKKLNIEINKRTFCAFFVPKYSPAS